MASFTFLIPTKNRHACLARSLISVLLAARKTGAEVIVCDQSQTPFPDQDGIRVLHRPDLNGLPAARNALLRATDAEVVCFLDDDTDVAADFALQLRDVIANQPMVDGWGPVVETRPQAVQRLHRIAHLGCLRDARRLVSGRNDGPARALFGCCFAVRRAAALRTGFDARRAGYALGEDLDFFLRLRAPLRFVLSLRAVHRRDGHDRTTAIARGRAKGAFLVWLARRHGRDNPCTLMHLIVALIAAASGRGHEPASWRGVVAGALPAFI